MARLILERNKQVLRDFPFRKGSITIGRNRDNTIVINSPEISAYHARIDRKGVEYILTDLQSTNGSFVNGMDVVSHRLAHGDKISFGKHVFLFVGTAKDKLNEQKKKLDLNQTLIFGGPKKRKTSLKQENARKDVNVQKVQQRPLLRNLATISLCILATALGAAYMLGGKQTFTEWLAAFVASDTRNQHELRTTDSPNLGADTTSAGIAIVTKNVPAKPTSLPARVSAEPALYENDLSGNTYLQASQLQPGESSEEFENPNGDQSEGFDVSSLELEGIIWADNPRYSFAVINGFVVRLGTSFEGLNVTEIGRGYVVLQSSEVDSKIRLILR
jgi:pSer/pThr/pTyr-binding forkhead associated (FHA) protein